MYDVFISYAREDAARVRRLAAALVAARGWSVWSDSALRAGEQFPHEIQVALAEARCVLVVWSPHAIASQWVVAEASEGWDRHTLVPAIMEACEPPLPFRQTQAADLSDWRGSARAPAFLTLIDSIERVLATQAPPAPDELAQRAARLRVQQRRRRLAWTGAVAGVLAVLAGAIVLYRSLVVGSAADALAAQADALRAQVVAGRDDENEKRKWWYMLMEDPKRLDALELATQLAIEAYREAHTPRTEAALRALLAISPWSDEHLEIEHDVVALRFSADGRFVIASGGADGTLVWDRRNGQLGPRIAHGGLGGEEWKDRRGTRLLRGPFVLASSPVRNVIATAGPDHDAALWDIESGRELARYAHEDTVTAVSFAPSGEQLATVTEPGVVRVWDVATGALRWQAAQGSASYWVDVSPSGRYVVSASADGNVRVWTLAQGTLVATVAPGRGVEAARFSPDERMLATYGPDLTATAFWALPGAQREWEIPSAAYAGGGVVYAPDGSGLVFAGADGGLERWDTRLRTMMASTPGDIIIQLAASADRERVATADAGAVARVWDVRNGMELREMPYANWLTAIAISRDGRWLASAGWDSESSTAIEVTEIRPDDPVAAACKRVHANLTRSQWQRYVGASRPYRENCPASSAEAAPDTP